MTALAFQHFSPSSTSGTPCLGIRQCRPLKRQITMSIRDGDEIGSNLSRRLMCLQLFIAAVGAGQRANAEIVVDKYGGTVQKICPWAYFPCYQDGVFCFRPIYCEGKFSPEGSFNAAIIFTGLFAPAYAIWRRKAGLDPDPNTPEGKEFYLKRYGIQQRSTPASPRQLSRFFGKPKQMPDAPDSLTADVDLSVEVKEGSDN